ncbi:MAG: helix-turn-helix domain-containing protein [Rhodoferax sp.]
MPAITAQHPRAPALAQALRAALHHSLQSARHQALPLLTPPPCTVGSARAAGHFHLGAELFVQLGGYTRFHFPHQQCEVWAGQALVVPPKMLHDERVGGHQGQAFSNLVINADAQVVTCHLAHEAPAARPASLYLELCPHPESEQVQRWLADLARAPAHDPQGLWPLQQQALLCAVLSAVLRLLDTPQTSAPVGGVLLQRLHVLLRDRLGDPQLSVAALAQALGCSPDHLSQRYRAHTGNALWPEVVRMRLERAAELLRSDQLAIKEVAWCCGFASTSHFVQRFGQHYGAPPARWRAQQGRP